MLKFIRRAKTYVSHSEDQIFLKDFSKYIKTYQQNQKILNSYDLSILDRINHSDQVLQQTLQKNQEWFYKEIIRDQHIGIEIINRYFKQRYKYGFQETLISQTLQFLAKAQTLLPEDDPGYPDILGKNLFISNLYDSLSQDLNCFFSPKFQINCDDFANVMKSLAKLKMKDHNIVINILNKIKLIFGLQENNDFNLTISRDLILTPVLKGKMVDQQKFKEYLTNILSINQPNIQYLENIYEDPLQHNEQNQDLEQQLENLDNILKRTEIVINNKRALQFQFFSSIKTLRDNYFQLNQEEKKTFVKNDPYLLLSLQQVEYQLMQQGILSPRDLIIDENDQDADTQLDQIFSDQIQNFKLDPNLLVLSFQDYKEQVKYDIESLFDCGKKYEFDQNIEILYNFVQMLKNIDSLREYSYEVLKQKYEKTKDNYIENNYQFQYYYTRTFNQCQQVILEIIQSINKQNLTTLQLLKLQMIIQDVLLDLDYKQDILNSFQDNIKFTNDEILFILQNAEYIDKDILIRICQNNKEEIIKHINQQIDQADCKLISNIGCMLTSMLQEQLIQENYLIHVYRKLFSIGQLEYINQNQKFDNLIQIQHVMFMLKNHAQIDKNYYNNILVSQISQQVMTRLSNGIKKFKDDKNIIMQTLRQSFYDFQEEQRYIFQLENDNFNCYPIILTNHQGQTVFLDLVEENMNKNCGLLNSRNFLIENIIKQKFPQSQCSSKVIKISELTKCDKYYQSHKLDLKEDLQKTIDNIFQQQQNKEDELSQLLLDLSNNLIQNDKDNNFNFIISQMLKQLQKEILKFQNNARIKNRINSQIRFLIEFIQDQTKIDTSKIKNLLQNVDMQDENTYKYNFVGKRQIQNHDLNKKFDNCLSQILNFKVFSNPEYFLIQSWEAELKCKLQQSQLSMTNEFLYLDYSIVQKLLLPYISQRKQRKIQDLDVFWEYYIRQDINLDLKNKLYTIEQNFHEDQDLSQDQKWKLSLLNFSYEFRTQQNMEKCLTQLFEMKFFSKLLSKSDQYDKKSKSQFNSNELSKFLFDKTKVKSQYEKLITPYIVYKKQIDYYQNLVQNVLPEKIMNEQDLQEQNKLKTELEEQKLQYHKLMETFKNQFSLNYTPTEQKFLTKDYINVINYQDNDNQFEEENNEIYNIEQSELIMINNLYKNILLYKQKNQIQLSEEENKIQNMYKNAIKESFIQKQILLIEDIPNIKIKDVFDQKDYEIFDNLFPYTNISQFEDQNIKDLLIMMSLHFNSEQINLFESKEFINEFVSKKNIKLTENQLEDVQLLFNDQPQAQQNFNSLFKENKTYQNAQNIDEFEKQIYMEMFSLDRGGSDIDKKWLQQDLKELSQFIDKVNINSSDPRKDLQNCKLKRFSQKKI